MNKEELIKMFDEKDLVYSDIQRKEIKSFIFETIIPEVLKSVIYSEGEMKMFKLVNEKQFLWLNFYHENLKQKAKEQFWIEL